MINKSELLEDAKVEVTMEPSVNLIFMQCSGNDYKLNVDIKILLLFTSMRKIMFYELELECVMEVEVIKQ